MNYFIIAITLNLIITFIIIKFSYIHINITGDLKTNEPQKIHLNSTPRIGGLGIYITLAVIAAISASKTLNEYDLLVNLTFCAFPAFITGLIEDLTKKVSIRLRLTAISFSTGLAIYFLSILIKAVDITLFDSLLTLPWVSIIFTMFAITGLTNSYNLIDGLNGLSSMVGICILIAITYVAFKNNDLEIMYASLTFTGAVIGFFTYNYPRGLIFLGDGGAYLIGFVIACLSCSLTIRNDAISPWFPLLLNIYPIYETIFSIWRRKIYQKTNPSFPDRLHLHTLIYRRFLKRKYLRQKKNNALSVNSKSSTFLWLLSGMAIFPSVVWFDITWVLQCFVLVFCISYSLIYKGLIQLK